MLKITSYEFMRRTYPRAAYIGSDHGDGIGENESDALGFAIEPVYFDDDEGRHYFDALPFLVQP